MSRQDGCNLCEDCWFLCKKCHQINPASVWQMLIQFIRVPQHWFRLGTNRGPPDEDHRVIYFLQEAVAADEDDDDDEEEEEDPDTPDERDAKVFSEHFPDDRNLPANYKELVIPALNSRIDKVVQRSLKLSSR